MRIAALSQDADNTDWAGVTQEYVVVSMKQSEWTVSRVIWLSIWFSAHRCEDGNLTSNHLATEVWTAISLSIFLNERKVFRSGYFWISSSAYASCSYLVNHFPSNISPSKMCSNNSQLAFKNLSFLRSPLCHWSFSDLEWYLKSTLSHVCTIIPPSSRTH